VALYAGEMPTSKSGNMEYNTDIREIVMYEQENAFYETNLTRFREKQLDKEPVIVGNEIIGIYDDVGNAYRETIKSRVPGTFTIKHVREHPELIRIPSYFEGTML
jgi:hypothetical protein